MAIVAMTIMDMGGRVALMAMAKLVAWWHGGIDGMAGVALVAWLELVAMVAMTRI